jgi:hypothetical protein
VTLGNTIVAGNTGGDISGSGSYSQTYSLVGGQPRLAPLGDYGGPTQTMALLAGSPALDAGDPTQRGTADQRGVVRTGGVNIGAYQASASRFVLTAPRRVTAGTPFDLTVTAVDPLGQRAVGYAGTVTFSTTDPDPGVVLPADYSFTLADGGVHTFTDTGRGETTLQTRGRRTITATDTADGSILGRVTVKVRHARHAFPFLGIVTNQVAAWAATVAQAATRQAAEETSEGQPARSEATSAPVPFATVRHAQDAVFDAWADPLVDALAVSLTRQGL